MMDKCGNICFWLGVATLQDLMMDIRGGILCRCLYVSRLNDDESLWWHFFAGAVVGGWTLVAAFGLGVVVVLLQEDGDGHVRGGTIDPVLQRMQDGYGGTVCGGVSCWRCCGQKILTMDVSGVALFASWMLLWTQGYMWMDVARMAFTCGRCYGLRCVCVSSWCAG